MPRLVLVIDEFASLVAELPDFVKGLVSIAQRGRSLGIHLVLATQRPTGVVSADIRANTNLRISLRVTDDAESRDVIDARTRRGSRARRPAAATPGTGHSTLMPFQAGRVGGAGPTRAGRDPARAAAGLAGAWAGRAAGAGPAAGGGPRRTRARPTCRCWWRRSAADRARGRPAAEPVAAGPARARDPRDAARPGGREARRAERVTGWSAPWALEDHPADQAQRARTFTLGVRPPLRHRRPAVGAVDGAADPRRVGLAEVRRPGTCTSTPWTAATARSCRWTRWRTAAPSSSAPRSSGRPAAPPARRGGQPAPGAARASGYADLAEQRRRCRPASGCRTSCSCWTAGRASSAARRGRRRAADRWDPAAAARGRRVGCTW